MKLAKPFLFIAAMLVLNSCNSVPKKSEATLSLQNAYKKDFYIGVAIDTNQINGSIPQVSNLITKEFNSITAENCMKSMYLHPEKDRYDFKMSDKFVTLGEKNKMLIHGHTLIWHSQLAPWMTQIKDSASMSEVMTNHISSIVGKYKGKIGSWDVVNEALNDDGTLRKTVFLETYGKDYLITAFKLAAKADSKADLYYNDYNLCNAKKRNAAVEMIKNLQKSGAKIDGVGEQAHWNLTSPSLDEIEKTILDFSALGVKVAFTELDISVLPNPWEIVGADVNQRAEASEKMNPYPKVLPETIKAQLAARYEAIFKLFLKHQDKISRVTLWGVHDAQSWLNDWPIKGRTNYPLLFDREYNPKEAYKAILKLKETNN